MALFGKKTTTKDAPPEEVAAPTDDFSPEALAALAETLNSPGAQNGSALQVRKPVSFKNGAVLGINIGADSIKAVELTAKNGVCTVTGVAIGPTPPDSIANGVVISVNVLADAIKELIAPFKSRKAVTSVAGTGEVIVRVIEVPTMTDAELQENMRTDLDRYIPFPPSEVQWDAAAMRDLPMDPNSPNMDVLLVAARHELIELHLQLLEAIKVDPKAIDVEPLAAARALSGGLSTNGTNVDFDDVFAVLDIGASSTEISILRGDELVFTRTVPAAGNSMTKALADKLNLTHVDAERVKREKGDAFPEPDGTQSETSPATDTDAWDTTAWAAEESAGDDVTASDDTTPFDAASLEETTPSEESSTKAPSKPDAAPEVNSDPFDLDLFNAGPTQNEPEEQHQQKMPGAPDDDDDLSHLPTKPSEADANKSISTDIDDDDSFLPSIGGGSRATDQTPPAGGQISSFFDFDDRELDEQSEELPTIEGKPQHTEAPPREEDESGIIDWEDDSFLPSVAAASPTAATLPSAFTFPEDESPEPRIKPSPVTPTSVKPASGFTLDDAVASPPADLSKSTLPPLVDSPVLEGTSEEKAPIQDIDLSDILGDTAQEAPAAVDLDEGLGGTITLGDEGLGVGIGDGLGTGLEAEEKPRDEAAVNAILKPILDDLISELRRSLEYHAARYPDVPVKRLVLIGGGAKMKNLESYFAQNLSLIVSLGDPFQNVKVDSTSVNLQLTTELGSSFAVALGLAMREIIR